LLGPFSTSSSFSSFFFFKRASEDHIVFHKLLTSVLINVPLTSELCWYLVPDEACCLIFLWGCQHEPCLVCDRLSL
jgi:hypothetical protein